MKNHRDRRDTEGDFSRRARGLRRTNAKNSKSAETLLGRGVGEGLGGDFSEGVGGGSPDLAIGVAEEGDYRRRCRGGLRPVSCQSRSSASANPVCRVEELVRVVGKLGEFGHSPSGIGAQRRKGLRHPIAQQNTSPWSYDLREVLGELVGFVCPRGILCAKPGQQIR